MSAWDPRDLPRGGGHVSLHIDGSTAILTLDQPARRNAISPGMMADLADAASALEADASVGALIVTGAPGAFCAGGDLSAVRTTLMQPGAGAGMCAFMTDTLDRISALPVVIFAAVDGYALGGGAELITVADVVFAAEGATVGFVHAALGVSPGWGGGRRLAARIGAKRALCVLAFAERMSAAEAQAVGIVDTVVTEGTALEAAQARAARLARRPVAAVRAAVRIARGGDEAALFSALWGGPDHRAALARVKAGR